MSVGGSLMELGVEEYGFLPCCGGTQPCSCQDQGGTQRALKGPDSLGLGAFLSGFGVWWVALGLVCFGLFSGPSFMLPTSCAPNVHAFFRLVGRDFQWQMEVLSICLWVLVIREVDPHKLGLTSRS